jgi:type I restriction enzyme S subunit
VNSNWKECKLGDVATVRGGKRLPKGKMLKALPTNHPYIRITDFSGHKILLDGIQYVDDEIQKSIARYTVDAGDLIISIVGTLGLCAIIPKELDKANLTENCANIHIKEDEVEKLYLYYHLINTETQDTIVGFDVGSTQPKLPLYNVQKIDLLLPPPPEQRAIAGVLSSLDDKIDLLHRQNKTLEAMAETLFRQWFVEAVDEGWEEKPLSSIANFLNGLACQKYPPKNNFEKLPVLKIKELGSGISDSSDWATTHVSPEYIVQAGDVIFAWSASLMVKVWDGEKCVLNQHLFKVTSDQYPKWFYLAWCKHHLAEFISISLSHATTMGHIKRGDLDAAIVLVPSDTKLSSISKQMTPLLDRQIVNAKQIRTLQKLRDTLLPKLMSGEVRVDV